ncbi:unnamed protein product [Heterobilharzia americana]|nr:unnamed protein product [Heterobilharzia americana]
MSTHQHKNEVLQKRLDQKFSHQAGKCREATEKLFLVLKDIIRSTERYTKGCFKNLKTRSSSSSEEPVLVADLISDRVFSLLTGFHSLSGNFTSSLLQLTDSSEDGLPLVKGDDRKCLSHSFDEEYIKSHLVNSTRLVCMLKTSFELQEVAILSQISYVKGICTGNEKMSSNFTEEYLTELEKQCTELSSELAALELCEVMQTKLTGMGTNDENHLKHINELQKIIVQENCWLHFLTDVITLEHNSCKQVSQVFFTISQTFRECVYSSDELVKCDVSKYFEDAIIHLLLSSQLPPELFERLETNENRSEQIIDVLCCLQRSLSSYQNSTNVVSQKVNSGIQNIHRQLVHFKETFDFPNASLTKPPAKHAERLNPECIHDNWSGICAPELKAEFVNTCQELNDLEDQIHLLEIEVGNIFPH